MNNDGHFINLQGTTHIRNPSKEREALINEPFSSNINVYSVDYRWRHIPAKYIQHYRRIPFQVCAVTLVLVLVLIKTTCFSPNGNHVGYRNKSESSGVTMGHKRSYENAISLLKMDETIKCFSNFDVCNCPEPQKYENEQWTHGANKKILDIEAVTGWLEKQDVTSQKLDVVFYGDSITESWTGTRFGKYSEKQRPILDVFQNHFGGIVNPNAQYKGLALGLSGDTSANLLWRIQNGEMPPNLRSKVWWVLIGTNDFGRMKCSAESVIQGITAVIVELLQNKDEEDYVVVNSLLPRGDGTFWSAIKTVNKAIEEICHILKDADNQRIEFFNATDIFLKEDDIFKLDLNIMPDYLHPNEIGHELWAEEIGKTLRELIP